MSKITFIGAGSTIFVKNVLGDFMYRESLKDSEIVDLAEKTANFLPASKRSQLLQNGSLLQFNGKVL